MVACGAFVNKAGPLKKANLDVWDIEGLVDIDWDDSGFDETFINFHVFHWLCCIIPDIPPKQTVDTYIFIFSVPNKCWNIAALMFHSRSKINSLMALEEQRWDSLPNHPLGRACVSQPSWKSKLEIQASIIMQWMQWPVHPSFREAWVI